MANLDYLLSEAQGDLYIEVTHQDANRAAQVFNDEPQFDLYIDKVTSYRYESNDLDMMITFYRRLEDMHVEVMDSNVREHMDDRDADFSLEEKKDIDQNSMKGKKIKKSQLEELVREALRTNPTNINEAGKEYKWKEAPKSKYSDPNVVNKKEMLTQVAAAVDDLVKLTNEKGKYITPTLGGMRQTHTPETIVGQFLDKQIRGFVDKYDNDLEGIRVLEKNGYATYEPIWKDKEPKSVSGPDPRGASLDENPIGAMGQKRGGAVRVPKTTPVNQITQLTNKGVDVELFELEKQYFDYVDDEGRMAKRDLLKIAKYATELYKMMEDDTQLEGWVQAKLVKASDYMSAVKHYLEGEETLGEIRMFHDPLGYKKSEPNPKDLVYTKEFKGNGVYDILKNGKKIATVDGEGNANAYINKLKKELEEVSAEYRPKRPAPKVGDTVGNTVQGFDFTVVGIHGDRLEVEDQNTLKRFMTYIDNMYPIATANEITAYDYQQQQEPETLQGDQSLDIRGKLQKILKYLQDEPVDQVRNFVRIVNRDIHDYEQMSSNDILAKYRVMFPSPEPLQETKKNRRAKK